VLIFGYPTQASSVYTKIVLVFSKIIVFGCLYLVVCGHLHVLVEMER
jgi:hypothetical protein